jgi:trehalose 6-phosphate phosphatase
MSAQARLWYNRGVKDVLSREALDSLARFMETRPLLVFDYDGTLCPIVGHRDQAVIAAPVHGLLAELCELTACAVLTGRSRADILPRLAGLRLAQVVGSHGEDWERERPDATEAREQVASWRQRLASELAGVPGIEIEDKQLSLSVHYRLAPDRALAVRRIGEVLVALPGARAIGGKDVFNLLPCGCAGKGRALVELKRILARDSALFVGDDLTDEEVFELPDSERVFKVRVGEAAVTRAEYRLARQSDIEMLLDALLGIVRARVAADAGMPCLSG